MSLEDNSVTQLSTLDEPAVEDDLDAGDRPPRFAGEEAVPLRDAATAELERERDDRVRVLTRRRRPALPRPTRRSVAVLVAGLAAIAMIVVALAGGRSTGSVPAGSPIDARPAAIPPEHRKAEAAAPLPIPSPRPLTRRRADLAAERRAARRRVLARRRRHSAPTGDGARRRRHRARPRSAAGDVPSPDAPVAETSEPAEAPSAPVEATPEPEVVQEARPPEAPPAEPAPEPTRAPSPPPSESRSPAESEFDFER
jgi:hypothetical protein